MGVTHLAKFFMLKPPEINFDDGRWLIIGAIICFAIGLAAFAAALYVGG